MSKVDLIMPKMGESIMEATILKWLKKEGDVVKEDEAILEIATDKVDSEIPSPVDGIMGPILFQEEEVVEVGKVIAQILVGDETSESSGSNGSNTSAAIPEMEVEKSISESMLSGPEAVPYQPVNLESAAKLPEARPSVAGRFYSPLVRNIASKEGIAVEELDGIEGSGLKGRVTKHDLLNYISNRQSAQITSSSIQPSSVSAVGDGTQKLPNESVQIQTGQVDEGEPNAKKEASSNVADAGSQSFLSTDNVEIVQMDRMRKLIADHMVRSKKTSAHVTSFVEADVTNLVAWRNRVKEEFLRKHHQKITFTPIFIQAVIGAMKAFPGVNASVEGDKILIKHDINIGMATALPSGNLIVPVIHNADHYNLVGLTKQVNGLAQRARANQLKPEEIQGGTFTLTNVGTFGNVMGTPIINQPQVAILATGAIRKKPAVLETEFGDVIAIRQMMFLSLSYDHRVVDGFLGGSFLRKVADNLEAFDQETLI